VEWLPQLKSQHVRLQLVHDDSVTPILVQKSIEAAASGTAQTVDFNTTQQFLRVVSGDKIMQWLKDQLGPASPLQPARQDSRNSKASQQIIESNHDE
jgi:hypothetical protein